MTITDPFIDAGRSRNGGWSEAQLECIGVPWPPVKGWKAGAIGRDIDDETAGRFVALKDAHLPPADRRDWHHRTPDDRDPEVVIMETQIPRPSGDGGTP